MACVQMSLQLQNSLGGIDMDYQLKDKVALVTGAGSGIGRATALAFGCQGSRTVVSDINPDTGNETARMITEDGGEAIFVQADVTKAREVEALVDRAVAVYGRLDCAFNNAGLEAEGNLAAETAEQDFDRVVAINLKGVWLCMKYEIPQMLKQGGGGIVNTASAAGLVAWAGQSAYTAAKHGVVGLTRATAVEYAEMGIRINAICPGTIDTAMVQRLTEGDQEMRQAFHASHPMGRMGNPEEIATAVLWLCSDAASFVTGHPLSIDGGLVCR